MLTWQSGLTGIALMLALLCWLYRRFLTETWWFFTGTPFGQLVEDVVRWHGEQGIPFAQGEIDQLYERIRRAPNRAAECDAIRRELQLPPDDETE